MTTLLMSSRHTADNQALWRAAIVRGWSVVRSRGIRVPEINDPEIIVYLEALYAESIAHALSLNLLETPMDWLVNLPEEFRKRDIQLTTLGAARMLSKQVFVKPPNDKTFAAKIYSSGTQLPSEFEDRMPVLVAEPLRWEKEFRCFCLDGEVKTLSPYLRSGVLSERDGYRITNDEQNEATRFATEVLQTTQTITPRAIVIDVGTIADRGWGVVEANAAWGSGIYGCHPDLVLDVIRHATVRL